MAKKKKAVINPRGYATTSTPAKLQPKPVSAESKITVQPKDELKDESIKVVAASSKDALLQKLIDNDAFNSSKITADQNKEDYKRTNIPNTVPTLKITDNVEFTLIEYLRKSNCWQVIKQNELNQMMQLSETDLFERLNSVYQTLQKIGFSIEIIEKIIISSQSLDLHVILNWAMVFLNPEHLPVGLTDKHLHGKSGEQIGFVSNKSSAESAEPPVIKSMPSSKAAQSAAPPSVSSHASASKMLDHNIKTWILNQIQQEDEQGSEAETIPTNVHFASLKLQLTALKQFEAGDVKQKMNEIRDQMNDLKKQRDFNPKFANEEYTKMVVEKESSKPKKVKNAIPNGADDDMDLSGMFSETNLTSSSPSSTTIKILEMSISDSWTGKTPKQYLQNWLSKHRKDTKAVYKQINDGKSGFRYKVSLGGKEPISVEMNDVERVGTFREAEHFVSTKLLYLLHSQTSIYNSLPPCYRDLWLQYKKADQLAKENSSISEVEVRYNSLMSITETLKDEYKKGEGYVGNSANNANTSKTKQKDRIRSEIISNDIENLSKRLKFESADRASRKSVLELQRSSLPIYPMRKHILDVIKANQVVIICGETGSGKSTQVPHFILEDAIESGIGGSCNIVCTQPRRISALSIATRVCEEIGEDPNKVGSNSSLIGYQIRLESKSSKNTRLMFMTTGILLRRMESDGDLVGVTHVVVDEVHERSLDSDFLLLLLKGLCTRRPDLRIILMSATADAMKFSTYFANSLSAGFVDCFDVCPCVNVEGRTFPVESYFAEDAIEQTGYVLDENSEYACRRKTILKDGDKMKISGKGGRSYQQQIQWEESDSSDDDDTLSSSNSTSPNDFPYSSTTMKMVKRMDAHKINYDLIEQVILHIINTADLDSEDKGSVLVFLPGIGEIKRMYERMCANGLDEKNCLVVIPLHSVLGSKEQAKVFHPPPKNYRKIVLSTNIAETGITIPDVVYVIDTCMAKEVGYNAKLHITKLSQIFISKANCKQRSGRAGRVREGVCYHLVSRSVYDRFMDHRPPEILRLPLEEVCLRIRSIGYQGSISGFLADAIDPPPIKNIERSIEELVKVQALDDKELLTALGRKLVHFPVDVRLGKMILYGVVFQCLDPLLTIAATMSLGKSPFVRPFGTGTDSSIDSIWNKFKTGDSDLLSIATAYNEWRKVCANKNPYHRSVKDFCEVNYLSLQNLLMIQDTRSQLLSLLSDIVGKDVVASSSTDTTSPKYNACSGDLSILLFAITAGLYPNLLHVLPNQFLDNQPNPSGFVLYSPVSSSGSMSVSKKLIYPSKTKSLFSDGVSLKNPGWFSYHAMTGTSGTNKIQVQDLNRTSACNVVLLAGSPSKVEHRQQIISLDNEMIKIKCFARSSAALMLFSEHLKKEIENRILGNRGDDDDEIFKILKLLLHTEKKNWY